MYVQLDMETYKRLGCKEDDRFVDTDKYEIKTKICANREMYIETDKEANRNTRKYQQNNSQADRQTDTFSFMSLPSQQH